MKQRSRTPLYDAYMKKADREMGYAMIIAGVVLALMMAALVFAATRVSDDCTAQGGHLVTGPGSTVVGTSSNGGMVVGYAAGPTTCEPNR